VVGYIAEEDLDQIEGYAPYADESAEGEGNNVMMFIIPILLVAAAFYYKTMM